MHRESLNMLASSNGGRKRKAPEGREMTQLPPPPPPGLPILWYQTAVAPPPSNLQLRLDQPGPSSGAPQPPRFLTPQRQMPPPPPPRFPTPPQQMAPPPLFPTPPPPSSLAQQPYFDTALRLSVTPHAPHTEQGFKEDAPPLANNLHLHKDFIDQALKRNNDGVREMLEEMCRRQYTAVVTAAEEKAAKKLKEAEEEIVEVRTKNGELEAMLASYRTQAMAMAERLMALKETNSALNAALDEATHRRATPPAASNQGGGGDGAAEEEAQSSSLDPDQVVVVRISCKICWKGPATVMPWQCRHLCMCMNCARTTNCCPICDAIFQDCIEVKFY